MLDGEDLRTRPLVERKRRLLAIMPAVQCAERGRDLFRAACERDLKGVVGKWAHGPYQTDGRGTSWLKIKNPEYSQTQQRHELFRLRHAGHPGQRRAPRKCRAACLHVAVRR
jgi:ATP-dependent DNA ligase